MRRTSIFVGFALLSLAAACVGDDPAAGGGSSSGGSSSSSSSSGSGELDGAPSSSSGGSSSSSSSSGGADAGTILPTDVPGLTVWFDADRGIEGSVVTNWKEQTTLINARGDQGWTGGTCVAPARVPNEVKNHAVVRFNGVDNCIVLDQRFSDRYYTLATGLTMFFVTKPAPSSKNAESIFALGAEQGTIDNIMRLEREPTTQGAILYTRGIYSEEVQDFQGTSRSSSALFVPNEVHVTSISIAAGAEGTKNYASVQYYLDGAATSMVAREFVSLPGAPRKFTMIGRSFPANSFQPNYYTGDLGEIVIYKRPLEAAEREQVEAYLLAKWR